MDRAASRNIADLGSNPGSAPFFPLLQCLASTHNTGRSLFPLKVRGLFCTRLSQDHCSRCSLSRPNYIRLARYRAPVHSPCDSRNKKRPYFPIWVFSLLSLTDGCAILDLDLGRQILCRRCVRVSDRIMLDQIDVTPLWQTCLYNTAHIAESEVRKVEQSLLGTGVPNKKRASHLQASTRFLLKHDQPPPFALECLMIIPL